MKKKAKPDCPTLLALARDENAPLGSRLWAAQVIVWRRHLPKSFIQRVHEEFEAELVRHGIAEFDRERGKLMVEI